jgi:hypothetical protein
MGELELGVMVLRGEELPSFLLSRGDGNDSDLAGWRLKGKAR